ncbi:MAG: META domain-containing protein [Treponemataceae bacterium]|nr:META domain-containing protein [Treponemataceae bacterium]
MKKIIRLPALCALCFAILAISGCNSIKPYTPPPPETIRPKIVGEWFLIEMQDFEGSYYISDGISLILPESPENGLHGFAGVNLYNGSAEFTDKGFILGPIGVTKMLGDDEEMESEENFLRLLNLCTSVRVERITSEEGNTYPRLILFNETDGVKLTFTK